MASALNEESVQKKLQSVTNAQDSIQSLSLWIIHHKTHHKDIVRLWLKVFKKAKAAHRLTLFYLCNDVVQNCKRKNAIVYRESFKDVIKAASIFGRDQTIKAKVERIFGIWKERGVFDKSYIDGLYSIMGTNPPAASKPAKARHHRHKSKKTASPAAATGPSTTPPVTPKPATATPQVDPKIIAGFKPSTLIESMRTFTVLEQEVDLRHGQMEHIKLDASSVEAVRQLKDKTHGKEFSQQFEDSCVKLEEYLEKQEYENRHRKGILELMETAQHFYDEQYRDVKYVANAYKNFGTRITNMSKRLTELKKTLPEPIISPVPSPVLDAPSPGQTPQDDENIETVDMDMSDDDGNADMSAIESVNTPMEPVPAMAVYQPPTKKGLGLGDGLDKRIANLIPSLPMSVTSKKGLPEQDVFSPFPDSNLFAAKSALAGGSEGGSTPLSDERCSTPVQDEVPEVEPMEDKPEAANPIDILTKIISRSGKNSKAESNFLQSLSLLTSTVKSQFEKSKLVDYPVDDEAGNKENVEKEDSDDSDAGPASWAAWKAQSTPQQDEVKNTPPRPIPSIQSTRSVEEFQDEESNPEANVDGADSMQAQNPDMHITPAPNNIQQPHMTLLPPSVPQGILPSHPQGATQPPMAPPIMAAQPPLGPPPMQHRVAPQQPMIPPMSAAVPPPHIHPMSRPPLLGHHPAGPHPAVPNSLPSPIRMDQRPPLLTQRPPLMDQRPPLLAPPPPMPSPIRPVGHPPQMGPRIPGPPPMTPPASHSYMRPQLNIPPPHFSSPPPTPTGFNPHIGPPPHGFVPQSSPGQKENWPSSDGNQSTSPNALVPLVGPDVPNTQHPPPSAEIPNSMFSSPSPNKGPPKSILRNCQGPVLKEVSQASGDVPPPIAGPRPPSIPPSPTDMRPPPFHGQSQPVLQPGEDLIEFTEKLKRKSTESLPQGPPKQPAFMRNMNRPNLTTITPMEEVEEGNNGDQSDKNAPYSERSDVHSDSIHTIQSISSVVRRPEQIDRDNDGVDDRGPRMKPDHLHEYGGQDYREDPYYHRPHHERPHHHERAPHDRPPHPRGHFREHFRPPPPHYRDHGDRYGPSPNKRPYGGPYARRQPFYRY